MYIDKEKIQNVNVEDEMKQAYLDYAMSTIMGRALPDVRDGLKPVQRRILYGMQELGLRYNKPTRKSVKVVGEVMGNYHPHGDAAIYDALARLTQPFTYNVPLLDGQGNFGSIDGDRPAAARYTEVRLARISEYILQDLDKETVDFRPNFDNSTKEPVVMPTLVPNLLLNGSAGIAVGMATEIPSHNLNELIEGLKLLIDNPDTDTKALMGVINGPDFPTSGVIVGRKGIYDVYTTGRGKILIRGKIIKEVNSKGKVSLVITEIPYKENKTKLIESIVELIKNGKLDGVRDLRDETDRNGIRIVLELKSKEDHDAEIISNNLFKRTRLESSYSMIFLALVNGIPKTMGLKTILGHFIEHRKEVVTRRTKYLLRKAEERAHILEGLKIALANIDEVVDIIKKADDVNEARSKLMERFLLSAIQAQAILDMRLQKITSLEVRKLEEEYLELIKKIAYYKSVLNSESLVLQIIKEELDEFGSKFNIPRKTQIIDKVKELNDLDLIQEEDMIITITNRGFIKRVPESVYKTQRRGGKGLSALSTIDDDFVRKLFLASNHDMLLMFTNKGRVYALNTLDIPERSRTARGSSVANILTLEKDEYLCDYIPVKGFNEDEFLIFATRRGVIKKTRLSDYANINKRGLIAINIRDDDHLVSVINAKNGQSVMLYTKKALAIRVNIDTIREQGRATQGVKGVTLGKDDYVISAEGISDHDTILFISEKGFSKRTKAAEFKIQNRGGKGLIAMKLTPKTGRLAGALVVSDGDDLFGITQKGQIVRVKLEEIKIQGRSTMGVKFISLHDDDLLRDISRCMER
ncbi:MAG TPA: DNA gyrase subunit A [Firmicutes bacterium]|nr:DNA gyrase subunit A [Bacillota bacterium]